MQSDRLAAYRAPRQKQKWLWFLCCVVPELAAADVERWAATNTLRKPYVSYRRQVWTCVKRVARREYDALGEAALSFHLEEYR